MSSKSGSKKYSGKSTSNTSVKNHSGKSGPNTTAKSRSAKAAVNASAKRASGKASANASGKNSSGGDKTAGRLELLLKQFSVDKRDIPVYIVINLYLAYLCTFFMIYMHDLYFDITLTRAKCFMYGTISFIGLGILAYFIRQFIKTDAEGGMLKGDSEYLFFMKPGHMFKSPFFWAFMLLLSNFLSYLHAENRKAAFTGEEGRRLGLCMFIIIISMFFVLGYKAYVSVVIYIVFVAVSFFMFYIGIVQHFGVDYGSWRVNIRESQKTIFMSTIGNMNTFGGYICIFLAIGIAVMIFSKSLILRCFAAAAVFGGGFTVMTAKSDNVYLGTAAAALLLFYIAVYYKKLCEWAGAIMVMSAGFFTMAIVNDVEKGNKGHLNGIAKLIGSIKIMGCFFAVMVVILAVLLVLKHFKRELYEGFQCKRFLVAFTVIGVILAVIVIIWGIGAKHEFFVFNDRWGEYRGYIWNRSLRCYGKGDFATKVFGYGNESVRSVMSEFYLEEMKTVPKKIYDSSHNVLIQQLLTTGIIGLIAFVGFFISCMVCMIKNMKGSPAAAACLAGAAAHFAQALVNPEQPIVTPLFYVLLALGVGIVRKKRMDEKV